MSTAVDTAQVAPTILQALDLDPRQLMPFVLRELQFFPKSDSHGKPFRTVWPDHKGRPLGASFVF
jgi:hypothetical protein